MTIPTTECLKLETFKWNSTAHRAYLDIKQKIIDALVLQFPDHSKVFKVAYDTLVVGIGDILSQDGHHVAYFSEKLN